VRDFNTSGQGNKSAFDGAEPIEFKIDDDIFVAYPPTPGQAALFMAAQAKNRDIPDHVAGVIDFFDGLLDEESREVFNRRLLDRDDSLDFDIVSEIIEALFEEWSARPTQPSSASTSSRKSAGSRSTAKPRSRATTSQT
jgi:hypothetical protein